MVGEVSPTVVALHGRTVPLAADSDSTSCPQNPNDCVFGLRTTPSTCHGGQTLRQHPALFEGTAVEAGGQAGRLGGRQEPTRAVVRTLRLYY